MTSTDKEWALAPKLRRLVYAAGFASYRQAWLAIVARTGDPLAYKTFLQAMRGHKPMQATLVTILAGLEKTEDDLARARPATHRRLYTATAKGDKTNGQPAAEWFLTAKLRGLVYAAGFDSYTKAREAIVAATGARLSYLAFLEVMYGRVPRQRTLATILAGLGKTEDDLLRARPAPHRHLSTSGMKRRTG